MDTDSKGEREMLVDNAINYDCFTLTQRMRTLKDLMGMIYFVLLLLNSTDCNRIKQHSKIKAAWIQTVKWSK